MSQLQYIFNPVSKKNKKTKTSKRSVQVAKKKKSKAKKSGAKKSRRTRKNPMRGIVIGKSSKTKKVTGKVKGGMYNTPGEIKRGEAREASLKDKLKVTKGKKNKKARKALKSAIKKTSTILKKMKAKKQKELSDIKMHKAALKESGSSDKITVKNEYFGIAGGKVAKRKKNRKKKVSKKKAKKSSKKKSSSKKKHAKKKHTKKKARRSKKRAKKSVVAKVAKKARRGSKRKSSSRKRRSKKMSTVRGSFIGKFRKNPIGGGMGKGIVVKGMTITGYDVMEVGALALGGGLYGALNAALPKIPVVGQLQATLQRVPVIGTSLTPMVVGIAINVLSQKFLSKQPALMKYASMLGDGLVGAAVVGMGVNASQYVPGLNPSAMAGVDFTPMSGVDFTPSMHGVDFTPNMGILPSGMGSNADFGSTADFGGVDFTPEMHGIPDGLGSDDETMEETNADFGESMG